MGSRKLVILAAALVFLLVAAGALYRLLIGFPISIGGEEVGQTTTFFVLVISIALSMMLFSHSRNAGA
jgi:hypothetical protein